MVHAAAHGLVTMAGDAVQVTERFGAGVCDSRDLIAKTWETAFLLSCDSIENLKTQNLAQTVALAQNAAWNLKGLEMTEASLNDLGNKEIVGIDQRGGPELV